MIRQGTMNDLLEIDNLAVLVVDDMKASNIPQWDYNYPRKQHYLNDVKDRSLFVYEQNNQILGVSVIKPENDPPYETISTWLTDHTNSLVIHRVLVHPAQRKQGIAQALLDHAIQLGKHGQFASIKIDTHQDNYKMRRFLEKNHFQYVGYLEIINREAYELLLEDIL